MNWIAAVVSVESLAASSFQQNKAAAVSGKALKMLSLYSTHTQTHVHSQDEGDKLWQAIRNKRLEVSFLLPSWAKSCQNWLRWGKRG